MKLKYSILFALFCLLMQAFCIRADFDDDDDDDDKLEDIVLRERRADAPCASPETLEKKQFFLQLEVERKELKNRNNVIYTEVLFYKKGIRGWPLVTSWSMNGKSGIDEGKFLERKGVVTEYKVKYVDLRGRWKWLKNPQTGDLIFKNTATLSSPETKTKVTLKEPVRTLVMKVYPQNWEGVPFFEINAKYCPYVPPTIPTMPAPKPTTPASKKDQSEAEMDFDEFDMF